MHRFHSSVSGKMQWPTTSRAGIRRGCQTATTSLRIMWDSLRWCKDCQRTISYSQYVIPIILTDKSFTYLRKSPLFDLNLGDADSTMVSALVVWSQGRRFDPSSVHLREVIGQNFSLGNVPIHPSVMDTWCAKLIGVVIWHRKNDSTQKIPVPYL